ncbi:MULTISPECIES: sensor histidine kinase [unclassified Sphingomonas]|uniref:PAS domain-containing sensor histidine kinase n=1 Tax=unclassified Sphingomonas TaxID=196159 RepID=UPI0006FC10E9|nr:MULTISPECIES: HAMP domain-containing sensor histidine kinase [unclassified Sphingomonas]KQM98063.1 PAS domain-containing sensor histidine kinase [Sphingomonas sp. Leaf25]
MIARDSGLPPAFGRVSADGVLLDAEPRLAELNRRAGGAVGQPVAVPQIAALVRLVQRLGIELTRTITAADGEDDLELTVTARPDDLGIRLEAAGWHAGAPWQGEDTGREADFLRADADWLWTTDASLHLTHVSDHAGASHGFDPLTVLGQPVTRLFVLDDDGEGGFPLLGAVASQAMFDEQEAGVRGTPHRVRLAAVPRRDAAGRFAGFDGAAYAIVPDEPIVAEAPPPGDLSEAFSRRVGRALRDPLGRIIADADSMSARTEGPLTDDYTGYATDIASAARHLLGLVDDLEDLSAIERADFVVSVEDLDLADVARRAAGLLAVRASQGDVRIDRPSFDDSMAASGEFRRVLQILVNLIGNAVRYSPPGGMVWIRLERDRESACVIVADQGKGIAPEDHERIFEKFGRVDPGEPGGSGLGLYIARRLARAMDGDILLDSAPGEGARFVLLLPAR